MGFGEVGFGLGDLKRFGGRGDGRGTVGGMVSLATRQTPWIDDNTPARGGITMYMGVWRVAKLTIPPAIPPIVPPPPAPPNSLQVSPSMYHFSGHARGHFTALPDAADTTGLRELHGNTSVSHETWQRRIGWRRHVHLASCKACLGLLFVFLFSCFVVSCGVCLCFCFVVFRFSLISFIFKDFL